MSLNYDIRNRLTSGGVRGVTSSYTYDAEGVRQTMTTGGGTTTYTTSNHASLSQVLKRVGPGGRVAWCVYGLGLLYEVEPDLGAMTVVPGRMGSGCNCLTVVSAAAFDPFPT
jgi:YD repeat-containing protein